MLAVGKVVILAIDLDLDASHRTIEPGVCWRVSQGVVTILVGSGVYERLLDFLRAVKICTSGLRCQVAKPKGMIVATYLGGLRGERDDNWTARH